MAVSTFNFGVAALLLGASQVSGQAFGPDDQARFLSKWPEIEAKLYTEPLPSAVDFACKNKGGTNLGYTTISRSMTSSELQDLCSQNQVCTIQAGVTITMNSNLNVGGLMLKGKMVWNSQSQAASTQYLCAGYVALEDNGDFLLDIADAPNKKAIIYIKNNGGNHPHIGYRVFGGYRTPASANGFPRIQIKGEKKRRTWSVLAQPARTGDSKLRLVHNAVEMGWRVGDRIAIAATGKGFYSHAEAFFISGIDRNVVSIKQGQGVSSAAYNLDQDYLGDPASSMTAEVLLMSRNVLFTGDDFEETPCGRDECTCDGARNSCTQGLHTMMHGGGQSSFTETALLRMENARFEKCGQRGVLGRYCIHFHLLHKCEDCLASGNAIESGMQRGIIVHGSHLVQVEYNTLWNVRGAGIYVEDGNEMHVNIEYNAVACPEQFHGPLGGCTVPNTDNSQADTSVNQACYWTLSQAVNYRGNRASNCFNGIFWDTEFGPHGRADTLGKVCTVNAELGRVEGNVLHSLGRFGTYFVSHNYPRTSAERSVESDGLTVNGIHCPAFDSNGNDLGSPATMRHNIDYHNAFVGGYHLGDIQFRDHTTIGTNNLIYHKETKSFGDGCSSHYKNMVFQDGELSLPSGSSAVIFEDCTFRGSVVFESMHHCQQGITGAICNPTYLLLNPKVEISNGGSWFAMRRFAPDVHGSMYVLAPPHGRNPEGTLFPAGYISLCQGYHTYLLKMKTASGEQLCATADSLGVGDRYEHGILCKAPLRRFVVWRPEHYPSSAPLIGEVRAWRNNGAGELWQTFNLPFNNHNANIKRGWTFPILVGLDWEYTIKGPGESNIPEDYVIEFSDPVYGNRWTADQVRLKVQGRTCPQITTSQHDRRFIYADGTFSPAAGVDPVRGRGACSQQPDMPPVNCAAQPELDLLECPEKCNGDCPNGYCDCGSGKCRCDAGFFGENCEHDICADARCSNDGKCLARYLGGDLSPMESACICPSPFIGSTCEANPCEGETCNGHGVCKPTSEITTACQCTQPWGGERCTDECSCFNICNPHAGDGPLFCRVSDRACFYSGENVPDACCFANCDPCSNVACPQADHDCEYSATCVGGQCGTKQPKADGTVCHSKPWGTCQSGVCVAGAATPTVSTPTKRPVSPTPYPVNTPVVVVTAEPTPEAVSPTVSSGSIFGTSRVGSVDFWRSYRGIGFSVSGGSSSPVEWHDNLGRIQDGLNKVVSNGYNMIRTWGTGAWSDRICQHIISNSLDVKIQAGIWIADNNKNNYRAEFNSAMEVVMRYPDLHLGVSIGNEHEYQVGAPLLLEMVEYMKANWPNVPVTYNFLQPTLDDAAFAPIFAEMDYVNVNIYPGYFENLRNNAWTPTTQLNALKAYNPTQVPNGMPVVLGETGWQSSSPDTQRTIPATSSLIEYYILATEYLYSSNSGNTVFASGFYFNLADENWKGADDGWGLYLQGDGTGLGAPKEAIPTVDAIIGPPPPPPTGSPVVTPTGYPVPSGPAIFGTGKVNSKSFWSNYKGIGFSIAGGPNSPVDYLTAMPRIQDGINKVVSKGFNMIRTWGTESQWSAGVCEYISSNSIDVKIQAGIWVDNNNKNNYHAVFDSAMEVVMSYPDLHIGVSLGNEQENLLTPTMLLEMVQYMRETYPNVPLTYNFIEGSLNEAAFAPVFAALDYVNVNSYPGYFENVDNQNWTPEKQFNLLEAYRPAQVPNGKIVVLGETGWQSSSPQPMRVIDSIENTVAYFTMVTRYLYGSDSTNTVFAAGFFFNLADEAWKSNDDGWGLYMMGDQNAVGVAKGSIPTVQEVLGLTDPTGSPVTSPTGSPVTTPTGSPVTTPTGAPVITPKSVFGTDKVGEYSFWKSYRGIGFSVAGGSNSPGDYGGNHARIQDGLNKVVSNGYNMVRTWGTEAWSDLVCEHIISNSLDIKLQAGIWIDNANKDRYQAEFDSAMVSVMRYSELYLGVSIGNEQEHYIGAPKLLEMVQYMKQKYPHVPVTYNFLQHTLNDPAFASVFAAMDYVNVNIYPGYFDNLANNAWTPTVQLNALKAYNPTEVPNGMPIVLGETGWQSQSPDTQRTIPSTKYLIEYYSLATHYLYGETDNTVFASGFYFNLADENWKGVDDGWGLYLQGDQNAVGAAKGTIPTVFEILEAAKPVMVKVKVEFPNVDCEQAALDLLEEKVKVALASSASVSKDTIKLTGMCCKSGVMTLNYNVPMAAGSASGFTSTVQDQPAEVLGSEITSSYGVPKTTAIQSSAAMEPTASSQESQTNSMSGSLVAAIVGTVAVVILFAAVAVWCWRNRIRKDDRNYMVEDPNVIPKDQTKPILELVEKGDSGRDSKRSPSLSKGWLTLQDDEGEEYYWNSETGDVSFQKPRTSDSNILI